MKIKYKPKLGQKLYSLNVGNACRGKDQKLTEVTVSSVGRKYFTCTENGYSFGTKYEIETWCEVTKYSSNSILYNSPKDWEDEKEERDICKFISEKFKYGDNLGYFSLDKLREIKTLLTQP